MKVATLLWSLPLLTLLVAGSATARKASSPPPFLATGIACDDKEKQAWSRASFPSSSLYKLSQLRAGAVKKPQGRSAAKVPQEQGGTATVKSEIFNLVKAIVGVGVLSLPAGIAAFGNSPSALLPALGLIASIGILSGYCFGVIGKVCAYTGATSYRDAWSKSIGSFSWIPAWSTTLKTCLACLAIEMVLADTFCSLLATEKRTLTLVAVTTLLLLPLCWMKNLSSLAPFSLAGVLGMAYTGIAMAIRWSDGSYAEDGALLEAVPENLRPSFGDSLWTSVFRPSSLILVCMLSAAYMAHFNAPKFYMELKNNTLPRFYTVVACSFGVAILLMGFITGVGFLTFGKSCSGLILNNYADSDALMNVSRAAVAVSLVFSYPLVFQGCREGVLDVLNFPAEKRTNTCLNLTTLCLLSVITLLALSLNDVGSVTAFAGATLGNALTYLYPAIMYHGIVKKQDRKDESLGLMLSYLLAVFGAIIAVIGTKMALQQ